jgi:hypothetical protein
MHRYRKITIFLFQPPRASSAWPPPWSKSEPYRGRLFFLPRPSQREPSEGNLRQIADIHRPWSYSAPIGTGCLSGRPRPLCDAIAQHSGIAEAGAVQRQCTPVRVPCCGRKMRSCYLVAVGASSHAIKGRAQSPLRYQLPTGTENGDRRP